jgi:Flp pilus assembly protein TadG
MARARRGDDRGASTVEFALVVPIVVTLLGMAGFFAWHIYAVSQLERAAQRAARYAAVPTTEGAYAFDHCAVVDDVNTHLDAFAIDPARVSVSDDDGTLAVAACPSGAAAARPHGFVRVRLTHEMDNPFTSVLGFVLRSSGPWVISGSGEARVEDPT